MGAGYDTKFESLPIGVAEMSNRCWYLANEFANFTAHTQADDIAEIISC